MRRCGKGTEIANAVIFLLSPASSYITVSERSTDGGELLELEYTAEASPHNKGIDLPVDGGISAQRA